MLIRRSGLAVPALLAGAVLLSFSSACGKKDTPPAPQPALSASAAAPAAASTEPPPAAANGLHIAATTPSEVRPYLLGDAVFLATGRIILRVDDTGLHQDVRLQKGFPGTLVYDAVLANDKEGATFQMMGSWPDAAWIQAFGSTGGQDYQVVRNTYRWSKDHWQQVEQGYVRGVSPWRNGTAIGAAGGPDELKLILGGNKGYIASQPTRTPWAAAAEAEAKRAAAAASASGAAPEGPAPEAAPTTSASAAVAASAPPAASAAPGEAGNDGRQECTTELSGFPPVTTFLSPPEPGGILAFGSGEVFVASTTCADNHKSWAVERFPAAGKPSVIDRIESPKPGQDAWLSLVGRTPGDVYLFERAGQALYRFDGKSWTREQLPKPEDIADASVTADGTLWLVLGKALYQRSVGGTWAVVALPKYENADMSVQRVLALRNDAVWVIGQAAKMTVVATNVKTPAAIALPGDAAGAVAGGDKAAFGKGDTVVRLPASEVCEQPYVLLMEHCPATAKEFPEVAERIRGNPELAGVELVTETSQKWTFLGATAPSMDVAHKLVSAVNGVPKVDAKVFCHVPRVKTRISAATPAR